ncbi:MAG: DUF177 domain-containing protein [Actinobacteria bacterium]|nr:DUF177 domain-containing protein [Actinomycetota bacterium]
MPAITDQLDLDNLGLKPGGGMRFETAVRVGGYVFGAQRYELSAEPLPVLIDASRTSSGYVVRVRSKFAVKGPCMRCSDDFSLELKIDHSEVHEPSLDEELASDYVTGDDLDLAALVHDAVGLALPTSIAGELDGEGGCKSCGRTRQKLLELGVAAEDDADLDTVGDAPREPDPRWAKLRELEL